MDRKKITIIIAVFLLTIISFTVARGFLYYASYSPLVRFSGDFPTVTDNPCNDPYPGPTLVACPTKTATYNPYPPPPTETPIPTATPSDFIFLPIGIRD